MESESATATACCRTNFNSLTKQSMSGLTYRVLSPTSYEVIVHGGFAHDAFNARGQLNAWSILRLEECARTVGYWMPVGGGGVDRTPTVGGGGPAVDGSSTVDDAPTTFMDLDSFGCLMFTVAVTMEILPEVYSAATEKRPITASYAMANIGRTSFKYKTGLTFPGHSKPLVNVRIQTVFCDPDTRRPKAPHDSWREKYADLITDAETPLRIPALCLPQGDSVHVVEDMVRVMPSDLDPYMHLNWSQYLRYCIDVHYLYQSRLCGYQGNADCFRKVHRVEINYKGEATAGDEVKVKFWQSDDTGDKFAFLIFKQNNVICECSVSFYPVGSV